MGVKQSLMLKHILTNGNDDEGNPCSIILKKPY